jgi:two-component SAPR family response regulator
LFNIRILLFISTFLLSHIGSSQGISFNSSDKLIGVRTSYCVFSHTRPSFKGTFKIEFLLNIRESKTIGNIFSIKGMKDSDSYSLTYINNTEDSGFLKFNLDGVTNLLSIPLKKTAFGSKKWIEISIIFNPNLKRISVSVNGKIYTSEGYKLNNIIYPEIYFGKHGSVIDVPSMSIKKLYVGNEDQNYLFDLNNSKGEDVYDSRGKRCGTIKHPDWLINDSYYWKNRFYFSSKEVTCLTFDEKHQRFLITSPGVLVCYNFNEETTNTLSTKNRLPVPMRLGTSFINPTTNNLFVYEVNDVPLGKATIASINLDTLIWKTNSTLQLPQQRHHHNSLLNHKNNYYMIFGGFGNQRLANTFDFYDIRFNKWSSPTFKGDTISPRYFAGLAKTGENEILLFGGIGNKTGDQNIGKKYYYDCYKIDLLKKRIKRLWSLNRENIDMVSSRNMVLSQDKTSFYVLNYREYISKTSLQLYKYAIKNGDYEILGDSIPLISERITTNTNLYLNSKTNELFCAIQEFKLDGSNQIKIFSINNPPVSKKIIEKYDKKEIVPLKVLLTGFLGVVMVIIVVSVFYKKRKIKQEDLKRQLALISKQVSTNDQPLQIINSVSLFGKFTVINHLGRDISYLFSPNIKSLFLIILLNSSKQDTNGVTAEQINLALWPDKPVKKAINLKNVTLSQLRNIITDLKGVSVVYSNKSFSIEFDQEFYCDYFDYLIHLEKLKEDSLRNDTITRLNKIIKRGVFLRLVEDEYFDTFKKHFENETLKVIPYLIKEFFENQNYPPVISLTEILESIDSLSEIGFYYKIHAYLRLGMRDKAKKHYNSFILEHKKVLNDDFALTFEDVSKIIPEDII